jgi:TolB-like protein
VLHLKTLGGAVLAGDAGPLSGAAAQRKSLALLGLLAPAADRGVSRDKLMAFLWPDADTERAGHRLTQLIYALRRELGIDDLFLGSTDVRLNPTRVESDARQFRAARQSGRLEQACALYGGPFLDGFFLSNAPEFDRWVEVERAGFAREFTECLETLAADAAARGDLRKASEWWQQLADHDPLSSRVTVHLMSVLAAAGNRAGALERARSYQELVERELEAAPNPAVLALAQQLRERPATPGLRPPPRSGTSVAVLPFTNLSSVQQNDFFLEGLVEEVTDALSRLDAVRVASRRSAAVLAGENLDAREIGRRLEVDALLEGSVRQAEDRIRLSVQLVNVRDGRQLWSERFERDVTDVFALQDELASAISGAVKGPLAALRSSGPSPRG